MTTITPEAAQNDAGSHCIHCGRDNSGHEGEPCSDDCPMFDEVRPVEEVGK